MQEDRPASPLTAAMFAAVKGASSGDLEAAGNGAAGAAAPKVGMMRKPSAKKVSLPSLFDDEEEEARNPGKPPRDNPCAPFLHPFAAEKVQAPRQAAWAVHLAKRGAFPLNVFPSPSPFRRRRSASSSPSSSQRRS